MTWTKGAVIIKVYRGGRNAHVRFVAGKSGPPSKLSPWYFAPPPPQSACTQIFAPLLDSSTPLVHINNE